MKLMCANNEVNIEMSPAEFTTILGSAGLLSEFQQNGIGRLLFEIAIAHGNKMGANSLYGYASPTSSIKGVSNNEGTSYDKEQMALIDIYSHLGCEFIKNDDYFKFVKTWNREDVKEFENKEINEFISNIVEKNKQTTEEQSK